jgi:L-rhamnose isomerase/sugar isomerase
MTGPTLIDIEQIAAANAPLADGLQEDYAALARRLDRRGRNIEEVRARLAAFSVAVPSWGAGRGGTRFARFPIPGEPTDVHEKLEDCAIVQQLGRMTPRVSLHVPWDLVDDVAALAEEGRALGLGFDAVNSNSFQDQPGQAHSYANGSIAAADPAVRAQAVAHNIDCIAFGRALGSRALTLWVGDGSNLPGQQDFTRALDRYIEAAQDIHRALPDDWTLLLEHKLYEPAFYSSVIADWGTSILAAQEIGPRARCLVDLGHHAPSTNIEQIVSRLHRFGRLGGFHFNDSKYGDDDLDAGAIDPHQLFLVWNELVAAEARGGLDAAYMLDQSHNVTDPIESLIGSAEAVATAYAKALLVDRDALVHAQEAGDAMLAFRTLRMAYETDVQPIIAKVRADAGGAIDPIAAYRATGWRARCAQQRRPPHRGSGIV